MSSKVCFLFALALSTYLVNRSKGDVLWTLDEKFDDVIKVDFTSHTEVRRAVNVGRCASLCTSASWCSSFFFVPMTEKCLLNEFVFAKPGGGQPSPGARYFKADSAGCSSRQQFVWLRGQRMCIKVHTARANFSTAYSSCRKVASRLVVLDTRDKLRGFMAYMADQIKPVQRTYIGDLRDGLVNVRDTSNANRFDSLSGSLLPTGGPDLYWYRGRPNADGTIAGCQALLKRKFKDCELPRSFVCEKRLD